MKRNSRLLFTLITFIVIMGLLSVSMGAEEFSWYIKRNGQNQPFPPSNFDSIKNMGAYYIDCNLSDASDSKRLYLTFDAGYENGNVEKILDVLDSEGVPAAFFVLDNIILKNTDLVKRMAENGHLVCNHTKRHKNLSGATKEEIVRDLTELEDIYKRATGNEMAKFFRFPEGKYSQNAIAAVNDMGYKTVFWSFGYEDWDNNKQPSAEYAFKKIIDNTHNGAIILLHPTSATNAKIMRQLICKWREMGYSFGTLEELTR
jgi:peptidoglycan-N-acetylmuramic acid deacetylase